MTSANTYLSNATIAAISSAVGGPIAVIRLSGPKTAEVLSKLAPGVKTEPRMLVRADLKSPAGELLDQAMIVRFQAPNSFTGEDMAELHIHGGAFLASRILRELTLHDVRQALPGEFSFRAIRNGKLSYGMAFGIHDLITATNDAAAGMALEKMSGAQNSAISALTRDLDELAAQSEVAIDFSDQGIDLLSLRNLKTKIDAILSTLETLRQSYSRGSSIQDGIPVAFLGLPNAGKSSFFNALLGEDRSIVSSIAGTTRDLVREKLTLRGKCTSVTLKLEDTAGLRHSEDPVEKMGVQRTRSAAERAKLILFLVDSTGPVDQALAQWTALGPEQMRPKALGILTKSDLGTLDRKLLAPFGVDDWIETSALQGRGISEAATLIAERCETMVQRKPGEILLTRLDHLRAVEGAIEHLKRAVSTTAEDLFAADVWQAVRALSPVIGNRVPDDILGKIFSEFCIGK